MTTSRFTAPRSPELEPWTGFCGPQTAAAVASFDVNGVRLFSVPLLVVALALVKDAAARANYRLGRLSHDAATAIGTACREIADGRWHEQFVVDVRHGGSARHLQANADEVIAHRAQQTAGTGVTIVAADLDADLDLHPVSLRLAAILAAYDLLDDLRGLRRELRRRAEALGAALTADDAVLTSLRNRLGGYAHDVAQQELQLEQTLVELHEMVLPVAAESERGFAAAFTAELSASTGLSFALVPATASTRSAGSLLVLSRALKPVAVRLAQLWSGLSTLAEAGGLPAADGPRRRSEVVNRTALDVIGAVLLDEVRSADGPSRQVESALTVSVLGSMAQLGEATRAVVDWCREGLGTPQTLAA